jgi:signal transduction histidine kinase
MIRHHPRLALAFLAAGVLLVSILAGIVIPLRVQERDVFQNTIINGYAAVLYPEALQQLAESESALGGSSVEPAELLFPVLKTREQEGLGMLGVVVYDSEGNVVQAVPASMLLPELAPGDYPRLLGGEQISRYDPAFPLDRYFAGGSGSAGARKEPVLEVLLPLHGRDASKILGFVQYFISGRKVTNHSSLEGDLAAVDRQIRRQTAATLGIGATLIGAVLGGAYLLLLRQQRLIDERTEGLIHANFELTLAAKASALGQITSNLMHGLQGSVAGLRAVMADGESADWRSAAGYAERLQAMVQETVALLGDTEARVSYRLTGEELVESIRRRNCAAAGDRKVALNLAHGPKTELDSHRGSLLCLIATNLVQNAIAATPPGRKVEVALRQTDESLILSISDEGPGIPEEIRTRLFEPGKTTRPGGSGLGLAISQLLARQIGASLALVETGPAGTTFSLTLPLKT